MIKNIEQHPGKAFFAVAAAGFILRLFLLGSKSLWVDEAYAVGLMHLGPVELIRLSVSGSPHPPLAFLFLRLSTMLFGHGEVGFRMISAIASAMAVLPLMKFISRRLGVMPSVLAGLLWSVSPYAVSMGQEGWIYGIITFLGFTLIDISDRAWNGSRKALYALVPLALAGTLVQHMFWFFIAAAFGLYFVTDPDGRISWKSLLKVSLIFLVLYAPFSVLFIKQASFRAARISRAMLDMREVYAHRVFVRIPTVFARLIPGGVISEAGLGIVNDLKQIIMWVYFSILNVILLLFMFFKSGLKKSMRIWLLLVFVMPFLFFLVEDPTVRHLSILWIPLAFGAAAIWTRYKPAGYAIVLSAAVFLIPYYNIETFPYHRSDWRGAVALIEQNVSADDGILVMGGYSCAPAWRFYSVTEHPVVFHGGGDPYTESLDRGPSPSEELDSLLTLHEEVWVLHDYWGGPSTMDLLGDCRMVFGTWVSPEMEVLRVSR